MTDRQPTPPGSPAANASRRGNPFRSSRVKPGAIDYLFERTSSGVREEQSIAGLVQELESNDWQGAIVGPHGTGKSTLLAALRPAIEAAGHTTWTVELHDGERQLPWPDIQEHVLSGMLLIVDGYEQLSRWQKAKLKRHLARQKLGLIVTSHEIPPGLPILWTTHADQQTADAVLRELLADEPQLLASSSALTQELLKQHAGNLREVLFGLYDAFEEGRLSPESQD